MGTGNRDDIIFQHGVVTPGLTVAFLFGIALNVGFSVWLVAGPLLVLGIFASFLMLKPDTGLSFRTASVQTGFTADDPGAIEPGMWTPPGKAGVWVYFIGLGIYSLIGTVVLVIL